MGLISLDEFQRALHTCGYYFSDSMVGYLMREIHAKTQKDTVQYDDFMNVVFHVGKLIKMYKTTPHFRKGFELEDFLKTEFFENFWQGKLPFSCF
jgi:Ca2+-binding EF-hand superfamily protein